jgi:hypothetical protein
MVPTKLWCLSFQGEGGRSVMRLTSFCLNGEITQLAAWQQQKQAAGMRGDITKLSELVHCMLSLNILVAGRQCIFITPCN